ncbi:Hypothetical predicted protein [Mytilus galloprovincialis]|uniref:Uncharacterized protein n=1 Tax=Mytilus galloprovincialis TaxID=29158 RepID=A0A8B6CLZ4_MYTGA|nr:Hypothetical predicted protein [Mytilus galloprovincialis]
MPQVTAFFLRPVRKTLPRFIRIESIELRSSTKIKCHHKRNLVCINVSMVTDFETVKMTGSVNMQTSGISSRRQVEAQNKESNSMPHENEPKSSSSSQSDTDSDESNTESIDDTPEENMHVAVSKSATKVNPKKLSNVLGKASKKITKETFSFENKTNDILEEVENPKKNKKKTTKRRKKSGDATAKKSNIQTTMFQFGAGTPDSRSEKRPATTPTDEVHERSVPIQKPKGH